MEITERSELEGLEMHHILVTVWVNGMVMKDARIWSNIGLYLSGAQDMALHTYAARNEDLHSELYDELILLKRIARQYEAEINSGEFERNAVNMLRN